MKRIFIAVPLFLMAGVCLVALSNSISRKERQLQASQTAWLAQTQQLAEIETETAAARMKISDQKATLHKNVATTVLDQNLVEYLLSNDEKSASSELQAQILAGFGWGGNSSPDYVLVGKIALQNSNLKPLKTFPNNEKLTDKVIGVLAITTKEKQIVESAFAKAFDEIKTLAAQNMQREGPTNEMLSQFTIPVDAAFRESLNNNLFSTINSAIGSERGELLRKFFEYSRYSEDGAIGDRTNTLSIYRITSSPGYGYRSGWTWSNSSTVNTYPEPLKPGRFPNAFRFIFPGGWKEIAEREGFELPKEFESP